jgi:hypothetical protein
MEKENLTQEELKENLHYEPASGVLTWLETEELFIFNSPFVLLSLALYC